MNRTIFTIGTDHKYQNISGELSNEQHQGFVSLISEIANTKNIKLLSEENNIEALAEKSIEKSALQIIAAQMGEKHLFTEASRAYRAKNGMDQENSIRSSGFFNNLSEEKILSKIKQSYRQRERYWLAKIVESNVWPVLHVCGADHAVEFNKLVCGQGLSGTLLFQASEEMIKLYGIK